MNKRSSKNKIPTSISRGMKEVVSTNKGMLISRPAKEFLKELEEDIKMFDKVKSNNEKPIALGKYLKLRKKRRS